MTIANSTSGPRVRLPDNLESKQPLTTLEAEEVFRLVQWDIIHPPVAALFVLRQPNLLKLLDSTLRDLIVGGVAFFEYGKVSAFQAPWDLDDLWGAIMRKVKIDNQYAEMVKTNHLMATRLTQQLINKIKV